MNKQRKPRLTRRKADEGWPLVVYAWMIGLGIMGYLVVGELLLGHQAHPLHWASGLAGALVGCLIGWGWYRWRGDIV